MNNNLCNVSDEILKEVNNLVKKSGLSKEDFVNYLAKLYDANNIIDSNSYYDSFIA